MYITYCSKHDQTYLQHIKGNVSIAVLATTKPFGAFRLHVMLQIINRECPTTAQAAYVLLVRACFSVYLSNKSIYVICCGHVSHVLDNPLIWMHYLVGFTRGNSLGTPQGVTCYVNMFCPNYSNNISHLITPIPGKYVYTVHNSYVHNVHLLLHGKVYSTQFLCTQCACASGLTSTSVSFPLQLQGGSVGQSTSRDNISLRQPLSLRI